MAENLLLVELDNHGILTLTLNRPEKLNASSPEMRSLLKKELTGAEHNPDIRVVVITGAGRGFCSGQLIGSGNNPQNAPHANPRFLPNNPAGLDLTIIRALPQPVIASINGVAAGYGFALTLTCDLRIASDRATFAALWLARGITPEGMAMFTLPRTVGVSKALEIALLGKTVGAEEAERIGLVNEVVPHEHLAERTREIALKLAEGPPIAMGLTKRTMYMGVDPDFNPLAQAESWAIRRTFETEDRAEGLASFTQKRPPKFKGR